MTKKFRMELVEKLITLSTAGFGVAAALAWNEAIQAIIDEYLANFVSIGSGVFSKIIYAILVTTFAVLVTYQLAKLKKDGE